MSDPQAVDWQATKAVFRAWERLRIAYNGLMIPLVLVAVVATIRSPESDPGPPVGSPPATLLGWAVWSMVVVCYGFAANVCFLFGPMVESYLAWLGWKPSWLRFTLFFAGTAFTAVSAWLFVATTAPDMLGSASF